MGSCSSPRERERGNSEDGEKYTDWGILWRQHCQDLDLSLMLVVEGGVQDDFVEWENTRFSYSLAVEIILSELRCYRVHVKSPESVQISLGTCIYIQVP